MTLSIELPDQTVQELLEVTGQTDESAAVAMAVKDCLKRVKANDFVRQLVRGEFDYPYTNDELEALFDPTPNE